MTGIWANSMFTSEFRREYEAERERWLRKRFLWYAGVLGGLNLLTFSIGLILWIWRALSPQSAFALPDTWLNWLSEGLLAGVFLFAMRHVMRRQPHREEILTLAFWLIVISGGVHLALGAVGLERELAAAGSHEIRGLAVGFGGAVGLFASHLFACLFLPWTPRESFRPLVPLLVLNAVLSLWYSQSLLFTLLVIVGSPLIGVPGALVCWWRYSRFHDRFSMAMLRRRYSELKLDLVNARQIHEGLFPAPITTGNLRLAYIYEPMRQIGGDYLYACHTQLATGGLALNVVLIDVTGHGIPAALTVNRLHGELERIFAEDPSSTPGDVLSLLNRYVHLTLATHSVYATAFCARVLPDQDLLEYASAGHPPAFVRAVDGTIERLDSTTFVLGVAAAGDFEPGLRSLRFGRGDALIAYTDGALEVRDRAGRTLGIAGLERLIASECAQVGAWPRTVLSRVETHRHGGSADDTLVVEVSRPISSVTGAPKTAAGPAPEAMTAGAPAV